MTKSTVNPQRRTVLKGTAAAAGWGMLASAFDTVLPRGLMAADSLVGSRCLTILYAAGADVTFNFDYYKANHMAMIHELYGDAIRRFELRRPVVNSGGPAPAYAAVVNFWVNDLEAFAAAGMKHQQKLIDDIPNFTNSQAIIQNDEVWGEAGGELTVPGEGDRCLTILYPNGDDVRWDADYYRDHHMTLIMDLYGTGAISRFEVRKGISAIDGTSKPPFVGTVNIYIADQDKFAAAGQQHGQALRDDVENFSSVMPQAVNTDIFGLYNT